MDQRIQSMPKEEKAHFLRGVGNWKTYSVPRLGISSIRMSDGPIGIRKVKDDDDLGTAETSVCFPSGALLASSFDRNLLHDFGHILSEEAKAYQINIVLGPAMNIKRSPLGGRGFEYYSEDPYLTGELASAYVLGVEENGTGTSVKHFAANSQEYSRMCINEVIDERTLNEIYLRGFKKAIEKGKPATIMASYNKINGYHSTENPYLLTDVLRKEWNYQGVVISDWYAVNDPVSSVEAGLDIEMPQSYDVNYALTLEKMKDPEFESKADTSIDRILSLSKKYPLVEAKKLDFEEEHKKAIHIAEESLILLKNENVLPLKKEEKLAVIGPFAKSPRYQGGGSSHIQAYKTVDFLSLLKDVNYEYDDGYSLDEEKEDFTHATEIAKNADKVLLFLGIPESLESEGYDRKSLSLPLPQLKLVEEVTKVNSHVIVILMNGGPLEMPFIDQVQGIVETYLGGEGISEALYSVLYGEVNPSGHLAETFPVSLEDTPCYKNFPGNPFDVLYSESIYVGYRYYSTYHVPTLFPFGFGLSYTKFEYSDFQLKEIEGKIRLSVSVKNIGACKGKTVPQFYVSKPRNEVFNPKIELCGFDKVELNPLESKRVEIEVEPDAFMYYNIQKHSFVPLFGEYKFYIGENAEHLLFSTSYRKEGVNQDIPYSKDKLPSYYGDKVNDFDQNEFEGLFLGSLPLSDRNKPYGKDSSYAQAAYQGSKGAKRFLKLLNRIKAIRENELIKQQLFNGPVRMLQYNLGLSDSCMKHFYGIMESKHYLHHLIHLALTLYPYWKKAKI